jgi:hypothetical protein
LRPVSGAGTIAPLQKNKDNTVWLLLLPFIGLLWLPFYNHELPALFGFPFFYWYQLLWVPATALLIWIVYQRGKKNGVE